MEFHEKLQELRKQKGLTQEELAELLYVSRTAVSKWESGRGYPNIDSLKAIAAFFSVTIDELLSGGEMLSVAEKDRKEKEAGVRALLFGLLDCGAALLFFLPLFAQRTDGTIQGVSLLSLTGSAPYLQAAYYAVVIGLAASGILALALQNCRQAFWERNGTRISLLLHGAGVLLCIISLQPYAATFLLLFLAINVLFLMKRK